MPNAGLKYVEAVASHGQKSFFQVEPALAENDLAASGRAHRAVTCSPVDDLLYTPARRPCTWLRPHIIDMIAMAVPEPVDPVSVAIRDVAAMVVTPVVVFVE